MNYENLLEVVTNRRSTRKFTDEKVAREDIEKIIDAARRSPSGFNSQPWEFVVIDNPQVKDKVSEYLIEGIGEGKTSKGFLDAPVYILLYGNKEVREKAPAHLKDNDNWWNFTFNTSLANAFMTMQYAATSLGYGTQWVSAFRSPVVDGKTKKLLNIPEHYEIFEMLALGKAAIKMPPKKAKDISEMLHYNEVKVEE